MNQESPHIFFRSQPMVCPYLDRHVEYQLFTRINRQLSNIEAMYFSNAGFRRSHNIMYRPICPDCSACISTRIDCENFKYNQAWNRIVNKNKDISRSLLTNDITYEQYELFHQYVTSRHSQGEMANMSFQEYADMIIQSPVETYIMEYKLNNHLVAACILDKFPDGFSAVYSFYDNTISSKRSLGSFIILDLIAHLKEQNLPYLYLGYWVQDSPKMSYKKKFSPLQGYVNNEWKNLD